MAEGLVNTTPNLSEAHTFEAKEDAKIMAHPTCEVVVSVEQERTKQFTFSKNT